MCLLTILGLCKEYKFYFIKLKGAYIYEPEESVKCAYC